MQEVVQLAGDRQHPEDEQASFREGRSTLNHYLLLQHPAD